MTVHIYSDGALCKNNIETDESEPYYSTTIGGTASIAVVNDKIYAAVLTPRLGRISNSNVLEGLAIVRSCRFAHDRLAGKVTVCSDSQGIITAWGKNKSTPDTQLSFIAYKRYLATTDIDLLWLPREVEYQRFADMCANLAGSLRHEQVYSTKQEVDTLLDCYYRSWHEYRGK